MCLSAILLPLLKSSRSLSLTPKASCSNSHSSLVYCTQDDITTVLFLPESFSQKISICILLHSFRNISMEMTNPRMSMAAFMYRTNELWTTLIKENFLIKWPVVNQSWSVRTSQLVELFHICVLRQKAVCSSAVVFQN